MKSLYVLAAYHAIKMLIALDKSKVDHIDLARAMIALGNYAQKNCNESTWGIRLEGVMLMHKPRPIDEQTAS